jgi:myxalamid-type polyketide synthase MxaE and MxaD
LCGGSEATVAVLPVDWAAFKRARGGRDYPLYRKLGASSGGAVGEQELRARMATASAVERRVLLEGVVRDNVAKVLKIAPAKLDARKTLGSMGLNSLLAMELRNRLEAALGRSLSATLTWNYPTVVALVEHFAGADAPAANSASVPMSSDADSGDLGEIAELTDEEALLALRGRAL